MSATNEAHAPNRAMAELEALRGYREGQHPTITVKSFEALDLDAIEALDAARPDLAPLADIYQVLRATQYMPVDDPARGRAIAVCIRIAHQYLWKASDEVADEQQNSAAGL